MNSWDITTMGTEPRRPEIVSSSDDARVIVINLPAGERLQDHEVHEHAWIVGVAGELRVTTPDGEVATGGPGLLVELQPHERHEVEALGDARFLLMLTPWPGDGHPGAMSLEEKDTARERAANR